jgi:hypothetical protein
VVTGAIPRDARPMGGVIAVRTSEFVELSKIPGTPAGKVP